jgi:hypothetical protein
MTLQEIVRLTGKSRRVVMRMVHAGKLPLPIEFYPMSWDEQAVMRAWKRLPAEESNGRQAKPRDGRSKHARAARLARIAGTAGKQA